MIPLLAAAGFCALAALLYAFRKQDAACTTRRATVRLVIVAAAGLALLPGCLVGTRGSQAAQDDDEDDDGAEGDDDPKTDRLTKWTRLGRIWRELAAHYKGERGDHQTGKAAFDKLKTEMDEALDALPAWPELRAVFDERWAHIDRSRYSMATCYKMMPGGLPEARHKVEEQVETLQQLVDEGKLTEEAALKAAGVLAVQAEYMARNQEAEQRGEDEAGWEAVRKLWEEYNNGKIEAGSQAELAGQRLTELTVGKLGWLTEPPEPGDDPLTVTCYAPPPPPPLTSSE